MHVIIQCLKQLLYIIVHYWYYKFCFKPQVFCVSVFSNIVLSKWMFSCYVYNSVFYKFDFCELSELMGREEGGVAVLTSRKVSTPNILLVCTVTVLNNMRSH